MIEQWAVHILTTVPDPGMTPGEYAIGAAIMGIILFVILSFTGEALMHVSKRAGGFLILLSLPAGGLFALVTFVIMVTG